MSSPSPELDDLAAFISRVPACNAISCRHEDWGWWVKLVIDIDDPLAWHAVQELGFVLNYISLNDRLPTVFMPVSPPPYLNGGPKDYLSWVIEGETKISPSAVLDELDGRLPRPVENREEWGLDDDE